MTEPVSSVFPLRIKKKKKKAFGKRIITTRSYSRFPLPYTDKLVVKVEHVISLMPVVLKLSSLIPYAVGIINPHFFSAFG